MNYVTMSLLNNSFIVWQPNVLKTRNNPRGTVSWESTFAVSKINSLNTRIYNNLFLYLCCLYRYLLTSILNFKRRTLSPPDFYEVVEHFQKCLCKNVGSKLKLDLRQKPKLLKMLIFHQKKACCFSKNKGEIISWHCPFKT